MTREYREYAKSRIEYLLKICRLDERDKEALEAAIKALSQEPCDDAISREAVIELIERGVGNKSVTIDGFTFGKSLMLYHVKQLPSVTQKSGKWIETEYHRWRCSVCREKGMSEWDNIHAVRTNFCPNCGADMRGAE